MFGLKSDNYHNPIALRKAKIAYSFGLSECYRVKASKTGVRPQGDLGEIVSLLDQISPCSELKEKIKYIAYIGKDKKKLAETSP